MGATLAIVGQGIALVGMAVDIGIRVYNFIEEKRKKGKEWSKQNKEDKYQNQFQKNYRQDRDIMNNYRRRNLQYNKMYDIRKDYNDYDYDDDVDYDYYQ